MKKRGLSGELERTGQGRIRVYEYMTRDGHNINSIDETSFFLVDIYETPSEIIVEAELPGVHRNNMNVYMIDRNIVIEGAKREKIETSGRVNFLCLERSFGLFRRVINIPAVVNSNKIKAKYANGILKITLPKSEEKRKRMKAIKIG